MTKSLARLAALLVAASAGCAPMCQSPWDYCNAVIGPGGTPNCNFGARYNSRFAPMNAMPASGPLEPTPAEGAPTEVEDPSNGELVPEPAAEPEGLYDAYDSYEPLPQ